MTGGSPDGIPSAASRLLHPAAARSPLARSLDRSLTALVAAGGMLAILQLVLLLPLDGPAGWLPGLFPLIFAGYVAAGIVAWYRRPSNRMGALILFTGAALYLGGMGNTDVPGLQAVGAVTATLVLAATIHLLLAFPSGRLQGRFVIAIVVTGYVTALVLRAPVYLLDAHGPSSALVIADAPQGVQIGVIVQGVVGAAVLIATAVVLIRRLRDATPVHRRVLWPLYAYGILAVLVLALSANLFGRVLHLSPIAVAVIQLIAVAGIPAAFALGILSGSFARTGQIEELGSWAGTAGPERAALTAALATALGDPSLEVAYWVPQAKSYVDADGMPTAPASGADRASVDIELAGAPLAAITYDSQLVEDPDSVRAAGRVVAILLERERLLAELRASRQALQLSRERLVDADDRGRARLAQDLHDGLQVQLVLLSIQAQQLANSLAASVERAGEAGSRSTEAAGAAPRAVPATRLREGIDGAAAELRRLVQSVMPAALVERGLAAACEDLADRMPIPTRVELDLGDEPAPPVVERTAYFVVAESLTNTVKYAQATSASVRIVREGDVLRAEVHDDGIGGAAAGGGAGMRSLAERVDVLGGTMVVVSNPGEGTHVMAEMPCES